MPDYTNGDVAARPSEFALPTASTPPVPSQIGLQRVRKM